MASSRRSCSALRISSASTASLNALQFSSAFLKVPLILGLYHCHTKTDYASLALCLALCFGLALRCSLKLFLLSFKGPSIAHCWRLFEGGFEVWEYGPQASGSAASLHSRSCSLFRASYQISMTLSAKCWHVASSWRSCSALCISCVSTASLNALQVSRAFLKVPLLLASRSAASLHSRSCSLFRASYQISMTLSAKCWHVASSWRRCSALCISCVQRLYSALSKFCGLCSKSL